MRTLLLLLAFLVSYGSLYPFGFQADDASWPEFLEFATDWSIRTSRGDFIANVLLFAPIGFVGLLASRREGRRRVPLSLTVAVALLLALALQVAQLWVPGRSPEVGDAVVNAIGLALGMAVAHALGRFGSQAGSGDRRSMLAIWLSLIEAAQIHVVSRTAEITDPLLALILGYALSRLNALQSPHRPAPTGSYPPARSVGG